MKEEPCIEFKAWPSSVTGDERFKEDNNIKSMSRSAAGIVFSSTGRDCEGIIERYLSRASRSSLL